ncbi:hypothetical protein CRENBAI_012371 [Crenichthys baileyi]|uniref:Uncharacterized protein n=1 Tax=Crenichthys baileyi TaxID=28760 RepID=A0AAV9S6J8_9TELE
MCLNCNEVFSCTFDGKHVDQGLNNVLQHTPFSSTYIKCTLSGIYREPIKTMRCIKHPCVCLCVLGLFGLLASVLPAMFTPACMFASTFAQALPLSGPCLLYLYPCMFAETETTLTVFVFDDQEVRISSW